MGHWEGQDNESWKWVKCSLEAKRWRVKSGARRTVALLLAEGFLFACFYRRGLWARSRMNGRRKNGASKGQVAGIEKKKAGFSGSYD